ncbi:MAG: FAD-dependent thymidylate synthase [Oscillospiraceae bacterium]|jgi:thymidylate synthase (FAD)|nr:FAD-dependent thymidylate synthase [Oscillospiraceae bacterium]
MKEIGFSVILEDAIDGADLLRRLERAGRTCYKSEDRITGDSAQKFVAMLLRSGHESVLEHEKVTLRLICDRGVTHEIVRHRIGSYSQESTRYCNYGAEKFGREITCIRPSFWADDSPQLALWREAMRDAERHYFALLDAGATPQEARAVLPNALKTEIVVTYDLREWRHFLRLRLSPAAHPQIRELAAEIQRILRENVPVVFDEIITH